MNSPDLFVFAGECSGDLQGAAVLRELLTEVPFLTIIGVGGPEIRPYLRELVLPMESFQVMGFRDVFFSLPRLIRNFFLIRNAILKANPKKVVLIDSPDFTLRLAKSLRKKGYNGKIIQYVAPTVWAWRSGRIDDLERDFDLLMTLYPFEVQYFQKARLPTYYVGNPLVESVKAYKPNFNELYKLGIPEGKPVIALFPGSRANEVRHNLPILIEVARELQKTYPDALIAMTVEENNISDLDQDLIASDIIRVPKKWRYDLMHYSRLALAKSGTVTLELAVVGCPALVIYQLSFINYCIAKYIYSINLSHYCIVNILADREVYPEWISKVLDRKAMINKASKLYEEGYERSECLQGCQYVKDLFLESDYTPAKAIRELC